MAAAANSAGGRDRLMEAAKTLFGQGSYAEVSIGAVLKLAGVQAPTLYHHFGDKEGLYCEWALDALQAVGTAIESQMGESRADACLRACARALMQSGAPIHQILHDAHRMEKPESGERILGAYFEHVFEPLCGLFVQMAATGQITADPVDKTAQLFITVASSSALSSGGDPARDSDWVVDRFLSGVAV